MSFGKEQGQGSGSQETCLSVYVAWLRARGGGVFMCEKTYPRPEPGFCVPQHFWPRWVWRPQAAVSGRSPCCIGKPMPTWCSNC